MKARNLFSGTVLINGADTVTGYNAARSLINQGFTIYGQAENPASLYLKSKIWADIFITQSEVEELISCSKEIMARKTIKCFKPVLLLSQDKAVETVSSNRETLKDYFYFQLPKPDITTAFLDKTKFDHWARKNSVRVPLSRVASSEADLSNAFTEIPFPLIIKPLVRTPLWDKTYPNDKAFRLERKPDDLQPLFTLLRATPKLIIQQWISGGDEDVYFVLAHIGKRKTTAMTGRKITQWPVLTGSTGMCVSHDDPELLNLGLDILNKANYVGIGSVEFKRDTETGEYYVTEPTVGRNDFQSYIATCSGININLSYVLDCLGYAYQPQVSQRDALWFDELGYLRSLRATQTRDTALRFLRRLISNRFSAAHLSISDIIVSISFLQSVIRLVLHRSEKRSGHD